MTIRSPLGLLLEADHRRQLRHSAWWTVGIATLGLLNLVACAYLERFTGTGQDGDGFLLFLATESFFVLLAGAAVAGNGLESLARRTRVFPLTPATRFDLVFLALLRHRAILMLTGTAVFAGALLGPAGVPAIAGRILMISLLILLLITLMSALLILLIRPGAAARSILAAAGLVMAGFLITTAVMSPGPVLALLLPLRWAAAGVADVHQGNILPALWNALYLVASAGTCAWIGRRYA